MQGKVKVLGLFLLLAWLLPNAQGLSIAQTNGLSDDAIRKTLLLVARHQVCPIQNGDFTPVTSLEAARAAKPPVGIGWSNPWGVVLSGVLAASAATGDKETEAFVLKHNQIAASYFAWLSRLNSLTNASQNEIEAFKISTALEELMELDKTTMMDCCGTMGIALLESILRHEDRKPTAEQKQLATTIADYISRRQPRTPTGLFWRPEWGETVWADDLYKGCAFLSRWYEFTGDVTHLDEAAKQIIGMSKLLCDKDGLWVHGYFYSKQCSNGTKWGRANGWAMVATVEVLSAMPTNHPARPELIGILRQHIEAVEKVQAPSGMWHQVLDHPELWEETSCTAMFAYSIARAANRGWIEPSHLAVARKAFAAVCNHVQPDGAVTGVCEATGIFGGLDYYANRKRPVDELHGRGPVMLAGAELLMFSPATKPKP